MFFCWWTNLYDRRIIHKLSVIDHLEAELGTKLKSAQALRQSILRHAFTGLAERPEYAEDELEKALLDHLQRFLLELGAGFCFEARQFRVTVNNKHDRVDLVFYHRHLRCHVLLDLKIRAFRHTDAGQMNFYLNWFKANMKAEGDSPMVGGSMTFDFLDFEDAALCESIGQRSS